jgi:hypothetical protein
MRWRTRAALANKDALGISNESLRWAWPLTGQDASAAFGAAIISLREQSTPYHLAYGLLDHAGFLTRQGDAETAALAIDEARTIGGRLRCQPLLDRADDLEEAKPRIRA